MNLKVSHIHVFKTVTEGFKFINTNYSQKSFDPEKLKDNLHLKGICKISTHTVVIIDEFGLLD